MNVKELIYQQINESGALPFSDYMHLALYSPGLGYYSSGLQKFGLEGDFITAPELTPLFGYTLANQCQQILQDLPMPTIFEFGAGSGQLCVQILRHLASRNCLPDHYYILEVSGTLRARQQALISSSVPHLFNRVVWLDSWPSLPFNGVILANEMLDAMPVHRFKITEEGLYESYIDIDHAGNLTEKYELCTNSQLTNYVNDAVPANPLPYQSEANLFIDSWIKECYEMLVRGAMILIDYGFPRHEYYHPDRSQGTLMCHYHHQTHANPLAHPGEEDITAHVDFTQIAEAAFATGFHVAGYGNQASFLLANGLLELLLEISDETERFNEQQKVKQLLHEHEMGELFKVIALSKDLDIDLQGFQLQDRRASL